MLPEYPPLIESAQDENYARDCSSCSFRSRALGVCEGQRYRALSPRGRTRDTATNELVAAGSHTDRSNQMFPRLKSGRSRRHSPKEEKAEGEETRNVWAARAEWADSNDVYDTVKGAKRALIGHTSSSFRPTPKVRKSSGDVTEDIKEIMLSQDIRQDLSSTRLLERA